MKHAERIQKQFNRLVIVWLFAALTGVLSAVHTQGQEVQEGIVQVIVGK